MRDIKFRAWNGKKMVFGPNDSGTSPSWVLALCEAIDAEPMQFTGVIDKNGVEIYEGDIIYNQDSFSCAVSWGDCADMNPTLRLVVLDDTKFDMAFIQEEIRDRGCSGYTFCTANGKLFEVIGNIHDTPDLLQNNSSEG